MGWGILSGTLTRGGKGAVFYDNITGTAFGPLLQNEKEAELFAEFLGGDPRMVSSEAKMDKQFHLFRKEHPLKGRTISVRSASNVKRRRK